MQAPTASKAIVRRSMAALLCATLTAVGAALHVGGSESLMAAQPCQYSATFTPQALGGTPRAGAEIIVVETGATTRSNAAGRFSVPIPGEGVWTIRATYPGIMPATIRIDVGPNCTIRSTTGSGGLPQSSPAPPPPPPPPPSPVAPPAATAAPSATQPPAGTEAVALAVGCTNVALTWPVGTPLSTIAAAISAPEALSSIFLPDSRRGGFRGYAPGVPSFANDYTTVEASLEAVFVCVRQAATLNRPVS